MLDIAAIIYDFRRFQRAISRDDYVCRCEERHATSITLPYSYVYATAAFVTFTPCVQRARVYRRHVYCRCRFAASRRYMLLCRRFHAYAAAAIYFTYAAAAFFFHCYHDVAMALYICRHALFFTPPPFRYGCCHADDR